MQSSTLRSVRELFAMCCNRWHEPYLYLRKPHVENVTENVKAVFLQNVASSRSLGGWGSLQSWSVNPEHARVCTMLLAIAPVAPSGLGSVGLSSVTWLCFRLRYTAGVAAFYCRPPSQPVTDCIMRCLLSVWPVLWWFIRVGYGIALRFFARPR